MLGNQIKALADRYLDHCNTLDSRYKLLHKLGEGRYGKVYLAFDLKTADVVAIKMLKETGFRHQLLSFFNEIRHLVFLLSCISCEKSLRATRMIDFSFEGRLNGSRPVAYYTMEYIELGEFYSLIEQAEQISENLAGHFLRQLTETLRILHSYRFYHLDIKPENVLVNEKGELYLCDFGNALYCKKPKEVHWRKVSFVGSIEYSAPEAYVLDELKDMKNGFASIREYDLGKLDVFSLGVLAFVAVVKSQPFAKAHDEDPYYKRLQATRENFWSIFEKLRPSSSDFKTLVENMLEATNGDRINISKLGARDWIAQKNSDAELRWELKSLIERRKQLFLKQLKSSLDHRALKRKPLYSHSSVGRYKDDEELLRQFSVRNENKILKLKYEISACLKNAHRSSPSEISSVSGNSSDNEF